MRKLWLCHRMEELPGQTSRPEKKRQNLSDVHTLSWQLSQELQWDILCPWPIIWFFKNKNWPKDTRKAYGSRQNIAVVIGNKGKFQKTIIYSLGILSNFLWKWSRWSSIFSEFRLMAAFFTTSHVPVCRVVLKFVDSYR